MTVGLIARRELLAGGTAVIVTPSIVAVRVADPVEVLPLWPAHPPGAPTILPDERVVERSKDPLVPDRVALSVACPTITVFRAAQPTGDAALVVPGGGFIRVALDKEGFETARWLAARGVTAFVLRYRFPRDGWADGALAPFQDAQRAMRVIRNEASRFAIDPMRLGVVGFSAGGLIAALLTMRASQKSYVPVDAMDNLSSRPIVAGLLYPVADGSHWLPPSSSEMIAGAVARYVTADAPPLFLAHAADDETVPAASTLDLYTAARRAGMKSDLHLFEEGGHGFGLRLPRTLPGHYWPDLFLAFANRHGWKGQFDPKDSTP